eukprot:1378387-Ditylum_brightwellii.AAC.1
MAFMGLEISHASFTTDSKERKELWSAHVAQTKQLTIGKSGTVYSLRKDLSFDDIKAISSSDIVETVSFCCGPTDDTSSIIIYTRK